MILVAAMISSAGSEEKSSWVLLHAISRVMGTTVRFCRHIQDSGLSRSMSRRPSLIIFASSQSTMSEITNCSPWMSRSSLSEKSPISKETRTCVSRLSIPLDAGWVEAPFDLDFSLRRAYQLEIVFNRNRSDLGNGPAPFSDDQPWRTELFQNSQALCLELAGADGVFLRLHNKIVFYDRSFDQSLLCSSRRTRRIQRWTLSYAWVINRRRSATSYGAR